jgi:hypothetical protein
LDTEPAAYTLDRHLTLYTYSLVSEYDRGRFDAFIKQDGRGPSQKEKLARVVESARLLVGGG